MSKYMENKMIATMYQVEIIMDFLTKNNIVSKEELLEMMKEKLDNTLMEESDKQEILSMVNL